MQSANLANKALRMADVGHVWEEKMSNATGTISLPAYSTFRVRAVAACTVTIDGVLAMTMGIGEIATFNTGKGDPADLIPGVSVVIAGGAAYLQLARDQDRKV